MTFCPASLIAPGWPGQFGVGGQFSLSSFMAGQSDGVWYDFSKTDRLFTADIGPTNVASVGDSIGLALDQRTWRGQTLAQVLAGAGELLVAGSWSMSVNGGTGTATESPAGTLNLTGDGTKTATGDQSFTTIAGKTYRLHCTVGNSAVGMNIGTTQGGSTIASSVVLNTGNADYYFTATGTTTWVRFFKASAVLATVSAVSSKQVGNYAATQSTSSLRGTYQTTGDKFDGSDDNLLTGYLAGSGANFIGAKTTVPATLAATQVILGASGSSANRVFLGINTSGLACGGVGSDSTTTIVGTSDLRSTEAKVFLTFDGTTVRLIVNGVVEYTAAQNSTPTTTIPFRLGATNNNGTAGSFYGGTARWLMAGRQFITAAQATQIGNAA